MLTTIIYSRTVGYQT